jgi:hypothetical protein
MTLLLTVMVASVTWPSEGARIPVVTGVIYDGYWEGSVSCLGLDELRFAGRMPAGNTAYPVVGSGSGCVAVLNGTLALDAQTLSGRAFHWDCVGSRFVWRKDTVLTVLKDELGDPFSVFTDLEELIGVGSGGFLTYSGSCAAQGFAPRFTLRMVLALDGDEFEGDKWRHPVKGVYWVKA